jgi:hypothetical protein
MSHVLVNVAWPYANGPRHIGHVAGFGVPSDVYARYERMKGNDVLMVSGTDEHGTPILVEAEKEGVTAQELANRYNRVIAKDLCDLGLSYDLFTRTTTGNHEHVVQEMFKQCLENGYIYKGTQQVAISPVHRPYSARPLHRRRVPDLPRRRCAWRPVRRLRQRARPGRAHQPRLQDQRRNPALRGDRALLPRPAGARRSQQGMAGDPQGLAYQRHQLLARPVQGSQAARHHP